MNFWLIFGPVTARARRDHARDERTAGLEASGRVAADSPAWRPPGDHPAEVAEWASSVTDMREAYVGLTEPFGTKQPMAGAHSNDTQLFLLLDSGPNSACYSPRFDARSK